MKRTLFLVLTMITLAVQAQTTHWGDQKNGTYVNPILPSDYSDPDVIRVQDVYYMVASDFHFIGMQILRSTDLVNWSVITQLYHRFDFPGWDENSHYAGGSWAPSIRYHNGRFWVYFCTPEEGLIMTSAVNPEGPWEPLTVVKSVQKWEDPCPFWDEDGQAYLGHSLKGAGPIFIHKMSADGKQLLDDGVEVYRGPVAEGTKIMKRNGYYYLSIPEGGVGGGWQTILRSRNIYGPFEKKVVLEQGSTTVNGPHQGALVDAPDGSWWFIHFQERSPLGRVVHLQPAWWKDEWPVIGIDIDRNGIGEPVMVWNMPKSTRPQEHRDTIQTSDPLTGKTLAPVWQFNHNPLNSAWSLSGKGKGLTFHVQQAETFKQARNTLTQKVLGFESKATVRVDLTNMAKGQHCGLACMGRQNHQIGVGRDDTSTYLYVEDDGVITERVPLKGEKMMTLGLKIDATNNQFNFFRINNHAEQIVGHSFQMKNGFWKGARIGLYGYNTLKSAGAVTFSHFEYNVEH